ncbi:E3 ubiquitin-protein ligase TRIM71-like [Mizuhopecten yessoensis]|uniref:E3 ubiquitin-protein ligase TRIM71-like n=1 Tax=Mizuhopecten yessoensis TaxID=6573 RepID=UPI000B45A0CA|nr:E3 ubiquitin-protein ligase TRIM71-like [Mizuhopecten yessoensis]XP_021379642.1 E3 ubiquitin-protein ligase TRIM71-like [Mizuhopecten yessoensis]XP_021379651.1 E3 ubiquitin-protein ligase TRIM71-like [Mizuhopecten yessoensis]XP_021379657.1 E3 ubiquitin-protein ligase TRIM71-like [Mizuhopecten yessoensis]
MATPQVAIGARGQTTCAHHQRVTLDWFCEKCSEPICVDCISSLHKGHAIINLSHVTPQYKCKIDNFIIETEQNELVQLQQQITSTKDSHKKSLDHFEVIAIEVKEHGAKLKENIDALLAQTLSQLKQLKDENSKPFITLLTDLETKLGQLKEQLKQCKSTLQTGTDIEVFHTVNELPKTTSSLPDQFIQGTVRFNPNKSHQELLKQAFGSLASSTSHQPSAEPPGLLSKLFSFGLQMSSTKEPTACSTQQNDIPPQTKARVITEWKAAYAIHAMCPTGDGGVWTCGDTTLTHLSRQGKIEQKKSVAARNMCVSPTTKNIWACSASSKSVMELTSDHFRFNTDGPPYCICITKDGLILVGTKNSITPYTTKGNPDVTTTTKSLLCSPRRISLCPVSENVAVVDRDLLADGGRDKPRVVVMNKHLKELFPYGQAQHASRTGSRSFDPYDVTYDSLGNMVIADRDNNSLHLLAGDGQYLRLLHTDQHQAWVLCVGNDGIIWATFGRFSGMRTVKLLEYDNKST